MKIVRKYPSGTSDIAVGKGDYIRVFLSTDTKNPVFEFDVSFPGKIRIIINTPLLVEEIRGRRGMIKIIKD
jgi:hypothetical protein